MKHTQEKKAKTKPYKKIQNISEKQAKFQKLKNVQLEVDPEGRKEEVGWAKKQLKK